MSKLNKKKLLRRLDSLWNKEKLEQCLKTANKILKSYPEESDVYLRKVQLLDILEKHDEIEATLYSYLKNSNKEPENYETVISNLSQYDFDESALKIINEGLELYPTDRDLVTLKAKILINIGEYNEALAYINKLSKTSPAWKDLLLIEARIFKMLKKWEYVLNVYDEILEYDEDDLITLNRKLNILKIADKEKIDDILNEMIEEDNNKNWALVNKGLYYNGEDKEIAMDFIDKVLEEDPSYGYGLFAKGKLLYKQEKFKEAKDFFEKALNGDSDLYFPELSYIMAKIFYKLDYIDMASETLDGIIEDDDIFDKASKLRTEVLKYRIAQLIEEKGPLI